MDRKLLQFFIDLFYDLGVLALFIEPGTLHDRMAHLRRNNIQMICRKIGKFPHCRVVCIVDLYGFLKTALLHHLSRNGRQNHKDLLILTDQIFQGCR